MKVKIISDKWGNYYHNAYADIGIKIGKTIEVTSEIHELGPSGNEEMMAYIIKDTHLYILKADCIEVSKLRANKLKRILK